MDKNIDWSNCDSDDDTNYTSLILHCVIMFYLIHTQRLLVCKLHIVTFVQTFTAPGHGLQLIQHV